MQIVEKKINDIKPYEKNPRKNDSAVDAVANSIREFGFKVPVVIDKDNVIVCGHTRYKAAQKLGLDTVPCVIADDLTDEQIKAYRLADNKVSELADWDIDLLGEELDGIFDIDMSEFGFDLEEDEEETEIIEDEVPEEVEPIAKQGDIYQLGNHRLMCGDSTSIDNLDKLLKQNNVDLVLTDPPYGVDIVKGKKVGGDSPVTFGGQIGGSVKAKCNTYMPIKGDDTTDTAREFYNACISKGINNYILFGGNYFTDFLTPKACWVVWDKENGDNKFADVELAWTSFDKGAKLYKWLWNGMSRKGDRKTEGKTRVHPTQKPVGLIAEILKDFSKENDNIFDGFGGSGSTLMACEQTNRTCYMIEYEPHYVDVIIARWEKFTGQKAVLING